MVVVVPAFIFAFVSLASTAVYAQTPSSATPDAQSQTEAAVFHVAGNSTQVTSDIVITNPTEASTWWGNVEEALVFFAKLSKSTPSVCRYADSKVDVAWTGTTPSTFAFQIINIDSSVRASGISLRADVETLKGAVRTRLGTVEAGSYFLRAYDPTDISKQIATTATFTVKPKDENPARGNTGIAPSIIAGAPGHSSITPLDRNSNSSTVVELKEDGSTDTAASSKDPQNGSTISAGASTFLNTASATRLVLVSLALIAVL
ncbi:hypothetical protein CBS101457_001301 [Exobasidium rhododendri]|nr:hypothetical protein CBS101457_001301 [Exobasidium rhododendri]